MTIAAASCLRFILWNTTVLFRFVQCWTTTLPPSFTGSLYHTNYPQRRRTLHDYIRMAATPLPTEETHDDNDQDEAPVWDPVQQIYVGGRVPDHGNIQALIAAHNGYLPIFGYGSLCWKPGGILADETVVRQLGQALEYQRCWCQKSTDHRGVPTFPGIVCTLLHQEEVRQILLLDEEKKEERSASTPSRTEGVLYTVPPPLVQACLDELDFREKGGYARQVIDVVLDDTGETTQAALYRGTPDNPALWPRVLRDPVYAAAVLAVATGDSGPNTDYLFHLQTFLEQHTDTTGAAGGGDDTITLARHVRTYQAARYQFYFVYGCGSNQHNQLLLQHYDKYLVNQEEANALTEVLVGVSSQSSSSSLLDDLPVGLYAGGGHSALLTQQGRLLLFGWNDMGQCGHYTRHDDNDNNISDSSSEPFVPWEFPRQVQACALGFGHTLALDATGTLWALGDNAKGQVCHTITSSHAVDQPVVPAALQGLSIVVMAAGLFHSAAVTTHGHVVTWGGGNTGTPNQSNSFQWSPPPGQSAVGVACGRKFTLAWLSDGTIWSWGNDNKFGQLGRESHTDTVNVPTRIALPWSTVDYEILQVETGWSHVVVLLQNKQTLDRILYGWGRNDKGQLGLGHTNAVNRPTQIGMGDANTLPQTVSCGSEFTVGVSMDGNLWACGWNEHGNLGYSTPNSDFSSTWQPLHHARLVHPPDSTSAEAMFPVCAAAGGSHVLAGRVFSSSAT